MPPLYKQTAPSVQADINSLLGGKESIAVNISQPIYTIENIMLVFSPDKSLARHIRQWNKENWSEGGGFAEENNL